MVKKLRDKNRGNGMENKIKRDYFDNIGFVYLFWYNVFTFIEIFLPFSLMRKFVFKKTKQFSDKWVLGHTLLSISSIMVIGYSHLSLLKKVFLIYGAIRIFEIIVYQINVLLFHPYKVLVKEKKSRYKIQNPYRSVILLGHNLMEIVCWFTSASIYFSTDEIPLVKALMENIIRIFTFSYDQVADGLCCLQYIIFAEVICGIILVIISLAKLLGELPHIDLAFEDSDDTYDSEYKKSDKQFSEERQRKHKTQQIKRHKSVLNQSKRGIGK